MKYYLYFIKIDEEVIKFGITKNIFVRALRHYKKFARDLDLIEYYEIIKVFEFTNKYLHSSTEARLKKFIKLNDKFISKYNETELILISNYNEFQKKVEKLLLNVIEDYEIYDCEYRIIDENEIVDIYTHCINNVQKKINYNQNKKNIKKDAKIYIDESINKNTKQLCPRCGKKVCRLKRHLYTGKKLCEAKYINVSADEIMGDYDRYLKDYTNKQLANKYKCECGKIYKYRQSLFVHRQTCNQNNQENNQINKSNKFNKLNNVLVLQTFGNEVMPNKEQFMNMVKTKLPEGKEDELFNEFFKLVHIDIPENRNIYLSNIKDGYINIFSKSKHWELIANYKFIQILFDNIKINLYKIITSIMIENHNDIDIVRIYIAYEEYIAYNNKTRMLNIKSILSKNKELLKESKKASQNATKINSIEINNIQNNATENDISNDIVEDTITDDDINKLIQKINNNEILEDDDTNLDSKLVKILGDNYMNYVNNILIKDDMLNRIKNYKII